MASYWLHSAQDTQSQISTFRGLLWAPMSRAAQLKACSHIHLPWLQMLGPYSSRHAVSNIHLPWPLMGSNGQGYTAQDMQSQISTSHGLLLAPMVRATQLMTCSLKSPPPMASYELQWSGPLCSRHSVSNLHLPWPSMGSNSQIGPS